MGMKGIANVMRQIKDERIKAEQIEKDRDEIERLRIYLQKKVQCEQRIVEAYSRMQMLNKRNYELIPVEKEGFFVLKEEENGAQLIKMHADDSLATLTFNPIFGFSAEEEMPLANDEFIAF